MTIKPFVILLMLSIACSGGEPQIPDEDGGSDASTPDGAPDPDAPGPDAMPEETDTSGWVFDEAVVRTYRLTLAPANWQWLKDHAILEEYVPASADIDGETVAASVRYKGDAGSLRRCLNSSGGVNFEKCDKVSMKISFNEVDNNAKFHGLKKINLHAMLSDPSKLHDAIGYKLFRDMGVPAPRTAFARLFVNNEDLGVFSVVENIDGRFSRRNFDDGGEGNLYKEAWPKTSNPNYYESMLTTNEDENPSVDKMVRFSNAVRDEGNNFREIISTWTDVDQLIGYFAVARMIDHWDDVVTWYCVEPDGGCRNHNYFWYERTDSDRLTLIPWDLDHTFEEPSPLRTTYGMPDWDDVDAGCEEISLYAGVPARPPACDTFLRRIVTELWPEYRSASQKLMQEGFSEVAIAARVEELRTLLMPQFETDPFITSSDFYWGAENIKEVSEIKREYISDKFN